MLYNSLRNQAKEITAMTKTSGWYTFADGYTTWRRGMSANEKKALIREHGLITRFIAD